ncbi:sodium- and chloride-dependent glycine transporter 2-like [Dermacentor silvarum]|uniref:sodium- and chloride-dependent glycine transporter 2-like n=1 Tax=Dermacentor silvarum TaxID=543639 RepID=UPI0021010986|nr:sodium- and chloride-dependent glycine transporter 2-like [Dermacentor silvarum]
MTSSEEEEGTQEVEQVTQSYQSRAHRLATLFIMTAGSANASQFPMMFIVYGGVPFLLAYLAFLGAVAFPLMRLESNLGQFAGDGNRGIFSTVPLFIGLGYTMSLYAIVHMVGDSVPVSDQLLYLLDSLHDATWNDCPTGLLLAPNRTCYVPRHAFSLCRIARARLMEAFRRQPLSHGVPSVAEGPDFSVVLVPPKVYRHEMAGCLPAVYNYLQPYQPCVCDTPCSLLTFFFSSRRHAGWFEDGWPALSEIRAEPILSLAAIWMVVFALAHHGFTTVKRTMYVMVFVHVCTTFLLLVRGVTLPGAMSGLGMLLYSDWSYAVNLEMWSNALYVSLESVGVTGSIYLGIVRFNNFKNDYHRVNCRPLEEACVVQCTENVLMT